MNTCWEMSCWTWPSMRGVHPECISALGPVSEPRSAGPGPLRRAGPVLFGWSFRIPWLLLTDRRFVQINLQILILFLRFWVSVILLHMTVQVHGHRYSLCITWKFSLKPFTHLLLRFKRRLLVLLVNLFEFRYSSIFSGLWTILAISCVFVLLFQTLWRPLLLLSTL